jgi:hypothetical protein
VLCETKTFYVFTILSRIITDICANADLLKIECHSSWICLTITCFWKNKCINLYYKWHWGFRSFHISTYTRVYERCARRNLRTKRNKDFGNKTNSFKLIRHTLILVLIIMSHFHPHPHISSILIKYSSCKYLRLLHYLHPMCILYLHKGAGIVSIEDLAGLRV